LSHQHAREDLHQGLGRQFEYLSRQTGADFIIQLRQWWRFIHAEPLVRSLIEEAVAEAVELVERFRQHEVAMAHELVGVRNEMVAVHAPLDDSGLAKPNAWDDPFGAMEHKNTFAHFDSVAAEAQKPGPVRLAIVGLDDDSAANELLGILSNKRHNAQHMRTNAAGATEHVADNQVPALDPIALKIADARERHDHFFSLLALDKAASAGFAVSRVQDLINDLVPEPKPLKSAADVLAKGNAMFNDALRGVPDGSVSLAEARAALFERKRDQKHEAALGNWERHLRPFTERVHQDLCSRLDRRRTLLGLMQRFKARCEWHDRDRLRAIGDGGNEDSLTAELARWLFDQGLSPITKPLVGGLQPDLLDPGLLYVEAKQYPGAGALIPQEGNAPAERHGDNASGNSVRCPGGLLCRLSTKRPQVCPA
jgi:hypothetical protein